MLNLGHSDSVCQQMYKHGATPSALASCLPRPRPLLPQPLPPHHLSLRIFHSQPAPHLPTVRPLLQLPLPLHQLLLRPLHQWGTLEPVLREQHGGSYLPTLLRGIGDLYSRPCLSFFSRYLLLSWLSGALNPCVCTRHHHSSTASGSSHVCTPRVHDRLSEELVLMNGWRSLHWYEFRLC